MSIIEIKNRLDAINPMLARTIAALLVMFIVWAFRRGFRATWDGLSPRMQKAPAVLIGALLGAATEDEIVTMFIAGFMNAVSAIGMWHFLKPAPKEPPPTKRVGKIPPVVGGILLVSMLGGCAPATTAPAKTPAADVVVMSGMRAIYQVWEWCEEHQRDKLKAYGAKAMAESKAAKLPPEEHAEVMMTWRQTSGFETRKRQLDLVHLTLLTFRDENGREGCGDACQKTRVRRSVEALIIVVKDLRSRRVAIPPEVESGLQALHALLGVV